jgi:hypothetical protein
LAVEGRSGIDQNQAIAQLGEVSGQFQGQTPAERLAAKIDRARGKQFVFNLNQIDHPLD